MNWGDVPAWVALVGAVGAIWVALLARKDSKRSADSAAEAVTLQREEAEARRQAAQPRVNLILQHDSGNGWILRNHGLATAENVTVDRSGPGSAVRDAPVGRTLSNGEGHLLYILDDYDTVETVAHLKVTWDGQDTPVAIPVGR